MCSSCRGQLVIGLVDVDILRRGAPCGLRDGWFVYWCASRCCQLGRHLGRTDVDALGITLDAVCTGDMHWRTPTSWQLDHKTSGWTFSSAAATPAPAAAAAWQMKNVKVICRPGTSSFSSVLLLRQCWPALWLAAHPVRLWWWSLCSAASRPYCLLVFFLFSWMVIIIKKSVHALIN